MAYDTTAHYKLFDLYDQRELLIFLQGAEWFDNQAIELLKKTVWKDYPDRDWKHQLILWEIDHGIPELE